MVVYNQNHSIRPTLFNYKQLVLHLNIDQFLQNPNSIKCCFNKYDNSFINNDYGDIITRNLNIVKNERLPYVIFKGPKYREPKQICFEEAREEMQSGIDQFIEYQTTKTSTRTFFQNRKAMFMSSVNEKIRTLKNKITSRSVKPTFSEYEIKKTLLSLKEVFMIVTFDKAANNVAMISKHFYDLTFIKELNLDCHSSKQDDNKICTFIKKKTKVQLINEHNLYLPEYKINLPNNMQDLPVMKWFPKMDKNPISFRLI